MEATITFGRLSCDCLSAVVLGGLPSQQQVYSGGPCTMFFGGWGRVSLDLKLRGPFEVKPFIGPPRSTLPGPDEGSSVLNVDLVVMTSVVLVRLASMAPDVLTRGINHGSVEQVVS